MVEQELYDEAKQLKAGIEQLEKLGSQIAKLDAQKRQAVEREDYDEAKAIKVDVDSCVLNTVLFGCKQVIWCAVLK